MIEKMEIYCNRPRFGHWIEILVGRIGAGGNLSAIGQPIAFVPVEDPAGCYLHDPTLRISDDAAQQLMDQLWTCGLRPSEGSGSAGSLAATERHLKDMQAITFGLLKKHGVSS